MFFWLRFGCLVRVFLIQPTDLSNQHTHSPYVLDNGELLYSSIWRKKKLQILLRCIVCPVHQFFCTLKCFWEIINSSSLCDKFNLMWYEPKSYLPSNRHNHPMNCFLMLCAKNTMELLILCDSSSAYPFTMCIFGFSLTYPLVCYWDFTSLTGWRNGLKGCHFNYTAEIPVESKAALHEVTHSDIHNVLISKNDGRSVAAEKQ